MHLNFTLTPTVWMHYNRCGTQKKLGSRQNKDQSVDPLHCKSNSFPRDKTRLFPQECLQRKWWRAQSWIKILSEHLWQRESQRWNKRTDENLGWIGQQARRYWKSKSLLHLLPPWVWWNFLFHYPLDEIQYTKRVTETTGKLKGRASSQSNLVIRGRQRNEGGLVFGWW